MKKCLLISLFLAGSLALYAQEKSIMNLMIECYEKYFDLNKEPNIPDNPTPAISKPEATTVICPPEPADFYHFFKTTFIDFRSLREEEKVKTFSFSDSLCSPLTRKLEVTSGYGMRNGKKHYGVDFRVKKGDTIRSVFCGKVRIAKWDKTYGYVLVIRHYNMSETVYAHLDKILVSVNQEVKVGQLVALGGNTGRSTGYHLHFELRYKGYPINPIVSGKFLKRIPVYY